MQQVRFSRVVYHMRPTSLSDDVALALPRKWFDGQKVRVVYVVTPDFTPERIDRIADLVAGNNVVNELSFRQKVNPDNTIRPHVREVSEGWPSKTLVVHPTG